MKCNSMIQKLRCAVSAFSVYANLSAVLFKNVRNVFRDSDGDLFAYVLPVTFVKCIKNYNYLQVFVLLEKPAKYIWE